MNNGYNKNNCNMGKIKVLHTKSRLSSDGATNVLYNFARELKSEVQFDFLLYSEEGNDWVPKFEELGSHIYYREAKEGNLITRGFSAISMYYEFLRTHAYNIVHIDTDSVARVDVLFCAWLCGCKKRIYHAHNSKRETSGRLTNISVFKWIMQELVVRLSTNLIACSTEAAKWMYPVKWLPKVKILKNGIYAEKFRFNTEMRFKIREKFSLNDCFVIGCVARFEKQKNHNFLIDIFADVVKVEPNARLLLIGDGKLKNNIIKKVENLGINKQVIFAGTTEKVEDYLCGMDIFVMPSLFEGLGMSLIEAQASGLYCLTSSNVPKEVKVSDRVEFISLDKGVKYWKDSILSRNINNELFDREYAWRDVVNAGYDIKDASKELLEIYESNT